MDCRYPYQPCIYTTGKFTWAPIESVPCDDTVALAYDAEQGRYYVIDFDHDSDPAYWRAQGLTHWQPLPEPPKESNQPWPPPTSKTAKP